MGADVAVGDVLLAFGGEPRPGARTDRPWRTELADGEGALFSQEPTSDWAGFPLRRVESDRWSLWLMGELYGVRGGADVDARLLDVATGRRPAAELNGHFLLVGRDRAERAWHVWTDRFGTVHAYHAPGARRAVGTCLTAVARQAQATRLDEDAILAFFGLGFFPADRTQLADVRVLRPATHHRFAATGELLSAERTWSWWHEPDARLGRRAAVDAFAERFREVMHDHLADARVALPISGGLDSRTTVAFLPHGAPATVWPYSYGYTDDSVELEIATAIARRRGLPLRRYIVPEYLFDGLAQAQRCLEGFQDVTQPRQLAVVRDLGLYADRVLAAHWGDVWMDVMGVAPGEDLVEAGLRKLAKPGAAWLLEHARLGEAGRGRPAREVLRAFVADEMARLPPIADPDFRLKALKTEQWSFRWTLASLRAFQTALYPRLPFYDTRVTDLFGELPSEMVADRRLQVEAIRRHAPDLARITWQARDANLYLYRLAPTLFAPRRAARKLLRAVTGRRVVERNWEIQFLGWQGRPNLERWLLRPGLRLHDVVEPAAVREVVDALYRGPVDARRGYTVSMLLTLSSWLELGGAR